MLLCLWIPFDKANALEVDTVQTEAEVHTNSASLVSKVAPGEFLPLSVKLLNFGSQNRVDVDVSYEILNKKGERVHFIKETVAVETTASFVKTIQIPFDVSPGEYTAKTYISYQGQLVPAVSSFPFKVERKIAGFFQSDFIYYLGFTLFISILTLIFGHTLMKHYRKNRLSPIDYSDIPHDLRIFYEILSDTIMEMRERVGDDAISIATKIDGLKIDKDTGRVLELSSSPAKIIATLVSEYEKLLGKKVSFSLRPEKKDL